MMVLSNICAAETVSPRCVIINEEMYVEMPTIDKNALHNGAVSRHLIPINEIYKTSCTYDKEKNILNFSFLPNFNQNDVHSREEMVTFDDTLSDEDEGALFIDCDVSGNAVEAEVKEKKTSTCNQETAVGIETHTIIEDVVNAQKEINGPKTCYTNTSRLKINHNNDVKLKAQSQIKKPKRLPKTLDCPYCSFKLGSNILKHLLHHMVKYFCLVHKQVIPLKKACMYIRDKNSVTLGCMKCPYRSRNEKQILEHVASHRNLFYSQCGQCGYSTKQTKICSSSLATLKKHVEKKHAKKMCFTPWFSLIPSSTQESIKNEEHRCPYCPNKILYNSTDYEEHVSEYHQTIQIFKCDSCKFTNCNKKRMEFHKNMHSRNVVKFKCPYCSYKCTKNFMLKYHMRDKHRRVFGNKMKEHILCNYRCTFLSVFLHQK